MSNDSNTNEQYTGQQHTEELREFTIGEAAQLLGVTTRTLRHWDSIGLLTPKYRTWSDYRLYTEADIDVALEILVYRSAGVSLKTIQELVGDASTKDRQQRLLAQREILSKKITDLRRMVRALDTLLKEGTTMDAEKMTELFGCNWPEYQAEAEQRWGDTPEWEQSQQVQQNMSTSDWAQVKAETEDFATALADAAARNVEPGSPEAAELVDRHLASITRFNDAGREKQILLARMYVADNRFDEMYGGNSQYLLKLVEGQARAEGIDPDNAQWR